MKYLITHMKVNYDTLRTEIIHDIEALQVSATRIRRRFIIGLRL